MSERTALFIRKDPFDTSTGYSDALKSLGWRTCLYHFNSKWAVEEFIKNENVSMIFTSCKFGLRSLPIDIINNRKIAVIIDVAGMDDDCENIIIDIENKLPYCIEDRDSPFTLNFSIDKIPPAGNILRAIPKTICASRDVAMFGNYESNHEHFVSWALMLVKHLDTTNRTYDVWGGDIWDKIGLRGAIPRKDLLPKAADIYASSRVCLNLSEDGSINESMFMVPLCGGLQITNAHNPDLPDVVGSFMRLSQSGFVSCMDELLTDRDFYEPTDILSSAMDVAEHDTYFNRLGLIFKLLGWQDDEEGARIKGASLATKHTWEMERKIEERPTKAV